MENPHHKSLYISETRGQRLTYNSELKDHSNDFEQKIWKVTDMSLEFCIPSYTKAFIK
jgi:hypothetical protein